MALSMTGFGAAEGMVAGQPVRVEIRTVNHRWFNLAARLPGELAALEGELREALRREFGRGHVSVTVRWIGDSGEQPKVDTARVAAVVALLRELRDRFGLAGEVSLDLVARQADIFGSRSAPDTDAATWDGLAPVVASAVAQCQAARRREGDVLAAELRGRLDGLDEVALRVAERAPARLVRERERLRQGVAHLLDGRPVDEARVAQELAVAADRLDITEELFRFRAHLGAAREALAGEQPVGKQLGFLAQELGREANTIGAKANDAAIAHDVVFMKGELEKFREQVENLE